MEISVMQTAGIFIVFIISVVVVILLVNRE